MRFARFFGALYLSTTLAFGCATPEQPKNSLEAISRSSSIAQDSNQTKVNSQPNLTQRVKELGWDFSKDNGSSFYYTRYVRPEYFDYLEACAEGVEEDLLAILEGDILGKIKQRSLDEFVRIKSLFSEVDGNPSDAKKILNSSYVMNIFPSEKELREVVNFRQRFPDSYSTFGIAFDTDRRGVLYYDVICGDHIEEDIGKYLRLVHRFEREAYTDRKIDISEFQRKLISEVEKTTSGRIKLSLVDVNNFQYDKQVF